jgi:hypothetical protein
VFIAFSLRLGPLPSTVPGLRQHILWLSLRRWLLRPSPTGLACGGHLLPESVGGLGGGRARAALLRSWKLFDVVCRAALFAGVLWDALWITSPCVQPFPMPFWAKPITHVGLLFITTIPECVRVPTRAQLCSAGCAGGFSVTAFHARFMVLMVSRNHGARASSWHQGERNCTSTASKLSKTWWSSTPHPWLRGHFEGTDRRDPLNMGWRRLSGKKTSPERKPSRTATAHPSSQVRRSRVPSALCTAGRNFPGTKAVGAW